VYPDLGLQEWEKKHDDGSFWTRVVNAIKSVNISLQSPELLLLFGEAASHESFRQAVVRALNEMNLSHLYEGWKTADLDPQYLAARGAARLAAVWQGSTAGCKERYACNEDGGRPEDGGVGITLGEMYRASMCVKSCRVGECR